MRFANKLGEKWEKRVKKGILGAVKRDFFAEKRVLLRKCFTFICVYQNFFVPLQPQKS